MLKLGYNVVNYCSGHPTYLIIHPYPTTISRFLVITTLHNLSIEIPLLQPHPTRQPLFLLNSEPGWPLIQLRFPCGRRRASRR